MQFACLGTELLFFRRKQRTKIVPLPARVCLMWEGPTREGDDHSNVNSAAESEADDFPERRGA